MIQPERLAGVGPFAGSSITGLASSIRSGRVTSVDLIEQALEAASTYAEALGCYVTVDAQGARREATIADLELRSGRDRGPLHGIPIAVKDMMATSGIRTTMGSRHFTDHVPDFDAEAVRTLRCAGAVIVAKTQTHEFAYGVTGDRSATGPARNPYDLGRMSGGSSGGSAAAVSAGLVPLALGTDTGGSIRIPAALCGVVGLRPTSGTLSMRGVFPLSGTLDTVGPIAASVSDVAIGWHALMRSDVDALHLPPAPFEGDLRVGIVRTGLVDSVAPSQAAALEHAEATLAEAGIPVEDVRLPRWEAARQLYGDIQGPEAYAVHHNRVSEQAHLYAPEVLDRLHAAAEVPGWRYVKALEERHSLRDEVLRAMADVDVLLLPTVPISAPYLQDRKPPGPGWRNPQEALLALTSPWSVMGMPAVSVPASAQDDPMPASAQLVAPPGHETTLLAAAAAVSVTST